MTRKDGKLVCYRSTLLKLPNKRNTEVTFAIRSTYNKVEFLVNNMVAIELRYKPIMSNGIGFYLYGAQVADFDDLEILMKVFRFCPCTGIWNIL